MLKNKQFELLKSKIIANEFIKINQDSIGLLFNNEITEELENNEFLIGDENIKSTKQIINDNIHKVESIEILSLLLNSSSGIKLISNFNFFKILSFIDNINLNSINTFCKNHQLLLKSNNFTILNFIISKLSPQPSLDLITTNEISNQLKDVSISLAFKNYKYRKEMLEYLLNNSKFYSIPSLNNNNNNNNKRFKGSSNSNNGEVVDKDDDDQIKRIKLYKILKIKSNNIKLKLINLGYFEPINIDKIKFKKDIDKSKVKELVYQIELLLSQILSNNQNENSNQSNHNLIKEIHKIFEINTIYDCGYLKVYDEPIYGMKESKILDYAIETFNLNSLNYYINLKQQQQQQQKDKTTTSKQTQQTININNFESILKFIKVYIENYKLVGNYTYDKIIKSFIYSIDSSDKYKQVIDLVSGINSKCFKSIFKNWSSIIKQLKYRPNHKPTIQVNDVETIDWIYNIQSKFDEKKIDMNCVMVIDNEYDYPT